MVQGKKLVPFIIRITLAVLTLLPLIKASQEHAETENSHTIKNDIRHNNKLSPELLFEIKLHGFLLWASMGFLMPVGILVIRMSDREECGRRLKIMFYTHATVQILALFLATAGAILSIRNFENSFNNNHQRIGLALYGVIWLQALVGFIRPQRGSKGRSVWFLLHWGLGTAVSLLGIINVYTGLQAYHKRIGSKSIYLWTTIFTAEVALVAFFYLFQDKWNYIKEQGVVILGDDDDEPIRPTDQEIMSPREKKKKKKKMNDFLAHETPCMLIDKPSL